GTVRRPSAISARRTAFFARRRKPRLRSIGGAGSALADMGVSPARDQRHSGVREAHADLAVALPRGGARRQRLVDPREIRGGPAHVNGARVVLEILAPLGA